MLDAVCSDINTSLSSLKDCIRALRERSSRVPYRRAKLTMLLKDCFETRTVSYPERLSTMTLIFAHVAPLSTCGQYTRSTLDYAAQLLEVSGLSSSSRHSKENCPPELWNKAQLRQWLLRVQGGRWAFVAPHLPLDGPTMRHTPTTGEFGLDTRMQLAGVADDQKLSEAKALGECFQEEIRQARAQRNNTHETSENKPTLTSAAREPIIIPPRVLNELLEYYGVHKPDFANPTKIARICRSFRARQQKHKLVQSSSADSSFLIAEFYNRKLAEPSLCRFYAAQRQNAGPAEMDEPPWVALLYSTLAEKNGDSGPREFKGSCVKNIF